MILGPDDQLPHKWRLLEEHQLALGDAWMINRKIERVVGDVPYLMRWLPLLGSTMVMAQFWVQQD